MNVGVGQALHREPPAHALTLLAHGATQPGVPLAIRADLDQLCKYDVQTLGFGSVRKHLNRLPLQDACVDWSDGSTCPWWLWLATPAPAQVSDVVDKGRGVTAVEVHIRGGSKSILFHTRAASKYTYSDKGNMTVKH